MAALNLPRLTADIRALIDEGAPGVWRFRPALALPSDTPLLSLGEGRTPVVELVAWGGGHGMSRCRAKLEFMAPTGSFKDRGAAPVIASLKAQGVAKVVEDSSGNAGAAMAAYAARAGLAADIYVPAAAPSAKLAQIAQYGAAVIPVEGTREDVADAAAAAAQAPGAAYASHSRHPAFVEGTKTFVLELLEHGVDDLPQHLVFPVGNGGLILGAHKALTELRQAGLPAARSGVQHGRGRAGCRRAPPNHRRRHRRRRPRPRRSRASGRARHRRTGRGGERGRDRECPQRPGSRRGPIR